MSTAFLFPGQGAQSVGMGRELIAEVPAAKSIFDRAAKVLDYDLAQVCFEGLPKSLIRRFTASRHCSSPPWLHWRL